MNTIIRGFVRPFRWLFRSSEPDKPKIAKAERGRRAAWREITERAPSKVRDGGTTEHAPDGQRSPEAPSSPTLPQTLASRVKIDTPPVPEAADVLDDIALAYPEGVSLTLPKRPWGNAAFRVWVWGAAVMLLFAGFILAIVVGPDVVPTVLVTLVLALAVRSLTIAYLENGLGRSDGARILISLNGSTAANNPHHRGGADAPP